MGEKEEILNLRPIPVIERLFDRYFHKEFSLKDKVLYGYC
jgi:hypothetical protein